MCTSVFTCVPTVRHGVKGDEERMRFLTEHYSPPRRAGRAIRRAVQQTCRKSRRTRVAFPPVYTAAEEEDQ